PNQNPTYSQPRNMMPKVDMRKFDGKDPLNWINQMENFFELHQTPSGQKVTLASLYLEPDQFVWYRWLCAQRQKNGLGVTWTVFTEELQLHYSSSVSENYFSQLAKLRQTGSVKDYVHQFQNLSLRVENIPEENLNDLFLGGLKDHIEHEVRMFNPLKLSDSIIMARRAEEKVLCSRRPPFINTKDRSISSPSFSRPIRLTPQQMEEKRAKGLCFNCDSKYGPGHKCAEKKLFYIDGGNEDDEDAEIIGEAEEPVEEEVEDHQPTISCHALSGISTPQTLK
ncbi:hypothetical protein KI387_042841, partial [Taxus chinensis]